MDLAQLRELLQLVAESDVAEVEVEQEGVKIVVRKNAPTFTVQQIPQMPPYGMGYMPMAYPPAPPQHGFNPASAPTPSAAPQYATPAAFSPEPAASEPRSTGNEVIVNAPIVGTLYLASSPEAAPFVKVGDRVKLGDVLCIIEAMKLMNEIECEVEGTIKQILIENAHPVEYDQPLFIIEKD